MRCESGPKEGSEEGTPHFSASVVCSPKVQQQRQVPRLPLVSFPSETAKLLQPYQWIFFLKRMGGSQNQIVTEIGKDLRRSSSPIPMLKQVPYSVLHMEASWRVLNIFRERDSTASPGSLFQCSVTVKARKIFLMFVWNFLCFSLCSCIPLK